MEFGDLRAAARMRDLMEQVADKIVDKKRPEPRLGYVYSVDQINQTVLIKFPGEVDLVKVRCAANMIPSLAATNVGEAAADIVRVTGKPGGYYIIDFVRGEPIPLLFERDAVHDNPDFEGVWANQNRSTGQPTIFPPGWTPFWASDNTGFFRDPFIKVRGKSSLKVTRPPTASTPTARVHSDNVFVVAPGDVVTFKIFAKASVSTATARIGLITSDNINETDFFSGNPTLTNTEQIVNLSTEWRSYVLRWTAPASAAYGRFTILLEDTGSVDCDFWLDDSSSHVERNPYEADTGWITPTLQSSWVAYGGGYQGPGIRKIGSQVFLRGLVKDGLYGTGNPMFTLPVGWRPSAQLILGNLGQSRVVDVTGDGTKTTTTASSHTHNVTYTLAANYSNAAGRLDIYADGSVIGVTASSQWMTLSGLSFFVD